MTLFLIILAAVAVWTVVWIVSPYTADSYKFQLWIQLGFSFVALLIFISVIQAMFLTYGR